MSREGTIWKGEVRERHSYTCCLAVLNWSDSLVGLGCCRVLGCTWASARGIAELPKSTSVLKKGRGGGGVTARPTLDASRRLELSELTPA